MYPSYNRSAVECEADCAADMSSDKDSEHHSPASDTAGQSPTNDAAANALVSPASTASSSSASTPPQWTAPSLSKTQNAAAPQTQASSSSYQPAHSHHTHHHVHGHAHHHAHHIDDDALTAPPSTQARLVVNINKIPIRTITLHIPHRYVLSREESAKVTAKHSAYQYVPMKIRIMGTFLPPHLHPPISTPAPPCNPPLPAKYEDIFVVAKDLCTLIHTRKGNVAKSIGSFLPSEKARMSVLCPRSNGSVSTHILTVLAMNGMYRLLNQSRSPLAPEIMKCIYSTVDAIQDEERHFENKGRDAHSSTDTSASHSPEPRDYSAPSNASASASGAGSHVMSEEEIEVTGIQVDFRLLTENNDIHFVPSSKDEMARINRQSVLQSTMALQGAMMHSPTSSQSMMRAMGGQRPLSPPMSAVTYFTGNAGQQHAMLPNHSPLPNSVYAHKREREEYDDSAHLRHRNMYPQTQLATSQTLSFGPQQNVQGGAPWTMQSRAGMTTSPTPLMTNLRQQELNALQRLHSIQQNIQQAAAQSLLSPMSASFHSPMAPYTSPTHQQTTAEPYYYAPPAPSLPLPQMKYQSQTSAPAAPLTQAAMPYQSQAAQSQPSPYSSAYQPQQTQNAQSSAQIPPSTTPPIVQTPYAALHSLMSAMTPPPNTSANNNGNNAPHSVSTQSLMTYAAEGAMQSNPYQYAYPSQQTNASQSASSYNAYNN